MDDSGGTSPRSVQVAGDAARVHGGDGGAAGLPCALQRVALDGRRVHGDGARVSVVAGDAAAGADESDALPSDAHARGGHDVAVLDDAAHGLDLRVGEGLDVDPVAALVVASGEPHPAHGAGHHERPEDGAVPGEVSEPRVALRIAEHGEGEAALLGLAVADGQMVVGGEDVDGERAEALHAVLAAAAGAERQEAGQQGLEHVEDVLPFRAGREIVGHGDQMAGQVEHGVLGAHGGRLGEQLGGERHGAPVQMVHQRLDEGALAAAARAHEHVRLLGMAAHEACGGGEQRVAVACPRRRCRGRPGRCTRGAGRRRRGRPRRGRPRASCRSPACTRRGGRCSRGRACNRSWRRQAWSLPEARATAPSGVISYSTQPRERTYSYSSRVPSVLRKHMARRMVWPCNRSASLNQSSAAGSTSAPLPPYSDARLAMGCHDTGMSRVMRLGMSRR